MLKKVVVGVSMLALSLIAIAKTPSCPEVLSAVCNMPTVDYLVIDKQNASCTHSMVSNAYVDDKGQLHNAPMISYAYTISLLPEAADKLNALTKARIGDMMISTMVNDKFVLLFPQKDALKNTKLPVDAFMMAKIQSPLGNKFEMSAIPNKAMLSWCIQS